MGNSASEGLLAVRTADVVAFMEVWSDMDPLSTGARGAAAFRLPPCFVSGGAYSWAPTAGRLRLGAYGWAPTAGRLRLPPAPVSRPALRFPLPLFQRERGRRYTRLSGRGPTAAALRRLYDRPFH